LRNLPPCQQTVEMISQSMERSLTPSERVKTRLHVWICVWCQWYLEQLQLIRDASRAQAEKAPEVMTDATLSNDARERIRRRLTNQE
jgi:ABC-type dipeptide/oligopeptide/nickel transport system ATPase subunit